MDGYGGDFHRKGVEIGVVTLQEWLFNVSFQRISGRMS